MSESPSRKDLGSYYTPPEVVRTLVSWAREQDPGGSVLDPSCGDGRFLAGWTDAVGVDIDPAAAAEASRRTHAEIITADFFAWATSTDRRFTAVVGNPPFIRYQRFSGRARRRALEFCAAQGVRLSGLCSSWAPFVVGASRLLKPGGRLAFVVPAEIGHAVYARDVVRYLLRSFARVEVVAVREKLFPDLSEDCWLLRASGFGGRSEAIHFIRLDSLGVGDGSWVFEPVSVDDLDRWDYRLRAFLVPSAIRSAYQEIAVHATARRLGNVARVGIGYVTGANDFFHLRPSVATALGIPREMLRVSVRSNRDLVVDVVDRDAVRTWIAADRPVLLLDLAGVTKLPRSVAAYLQSPEGLSASRTYKCRNRKPWFAVPDVRTPHAFLSIMSGRSPRLVGNSAGLTCTNSVHAVQFVNGSDAMRYVRSWRNELTTLSCELEGHALGGGVLKIEPAEARRVLLAPDLDLSEEQKEILRRGTAELRRWRHCRAA
jgi:predicted RNA methylase